MASYAENVSIWWRHHDSANIDKSMSKDSKDFNTYWTQVEMILYQPNGIHFNNTLSLRQNGHHLTDINAIFFHKNYYIFI